MTYIYECGNETISVWRTNDDVVAVEMYKDGHYRDYKRTVHEDENGKFFTWNHEKIYLDNFKKISIKSVKEKFENGDWVTDSELCQAILSEGIDKVRFIIPMSVVDCRINYNGYGLVATNPNNRVNKVCHIVEDFNRKVSDNYKLRLYADDEDMAVTYEDYYVSDLVGSLRSGYIQIV